MNQRVLYLQDNGVVAVVVPNPTELERRSIHQIARKDVPPGKPYRIVDVSDIPTDRYFRDVWEVALTELTDGVGNQTNTYED